MLYNFRTGPRSKPYIQSTCSVQVIETPLQHTHWNGVAILGFDVRCSDCHRQRTPRGCLGAHFPHSLFTSQLALN